MLLAKRNKIYAQIATRMKTSQLHDTKKVMGDKKNEVNKFKIMVESMI